MVTAYLRSGLNSSAQETFWGRYFRVTPRDVSNDCPAPHVRQLFARVFQQEPLGSRMFG